MGEPRARAQRVPRARHRSRAVGALLGRSGAQPTGLRGTGRRARAARPPPLRDAHEGTGQFGEPPMGQSLLGGPSLAGRSRLSRGVFNAQLLHSIKVLTFC